MREQGNADGVVALGVSMMGFIFYERSARFVGDATPTTSPEVKRVGVFVNAELEYMLNMAKSHALNYIQLHGTESLEVCRAIKSHGLGVIKAISVATPADIERAQEYDREVDFLLFDTKCAGYGGSGERFDWSMLNGYRGTTKFLLSGGIDENMAQEIGSISHPLFAGVDLNSRFESAPALKNIEKLKNFITELI